MDSPFQLRKISKQRVEALRKVASLGQAMVIEGFNGYLIVEPVGSDLGDGESFTTDAADYELQPVWCPVAPAKLRKVRALLGLHTDTPATLESTGGLTA